MRKLFFLILLASSVISISAQTKTRKPKKSASRTVAAKTAATAKQPAVDVETPVETPVKKNERPAEDAALPKDSTAKSNARPTAETKFAPVYFYTFSQPQFLVSKILIEHDETGAGKISFQKRDFGEFITDPIQLSPAALERVKATFNRLNFLDSKETYQTLDKNFAHLGTMTFAVKKTERERSAEFNWTENKDAKMLADEYRKIGQQFVWIFDINIARQNQPLETPSLVDALDSMIKRNEFSDAVQMVPFLKELNEDERLPLIARNHISRIVKEIEKKAEKK